MDINKFQKHGKPSVLSSRLQEENHPVLSNLRNLKVLKILKICGANFQSLRFQKLKISDFSTSNRKLKIKR